MADVRIVASGLGFPEGPVAMPDGSVILTEIRSRRISRVSPEGNVTPFSETGGGPNGLAMGPHGVLYGCNNGGSKYLPGSSMGQAPLDGYAGGWIEWIDMANGAAHKLYTQADGHRFSAPNDIVFDEHGGFWFTDLGKRHARHRDHGSLYYGLPDGSKVVEVAFPILSPNGVGLSPDNKVVYVADTESARLWAFDIIEPGVVEKFQGHAPHGGRFVAGLAGYARFDSLAVTASGNVCVATLGTGYITVISPAGEIVDQVKMPDVYPTNICFGGPDLRTAYITLSDKGQLGAMQWPEPGLKLHFT
ncbi:MAG: SMP-30/gluconolactonase/LRE family protein [Acetobacteraceae bacterium]|nr:SMP-30/gluconolactonase/LRE family protein [Acetobacteraceae bacterium]